MATDIHLFIEHRSAGGSEYVSLTDGEFNLPRVQYVFAALAGLRSEKPPLIAPRGFPDDASVEAHREYYDRVSEEGQHEDGSWHIVKRADAQRQVERGLSHRKAWRNIDLVSDPDAHHASWLSGPELDAVLEHAGIVTERLPREYRIVISALRLLADAGGRVVFWFDN